MKNKIAIFVALFSVFLIPSAMAAYEYTQRVTVENHIERKNTFVTSFENEDWLIHYQNGCGDIAEGDEVYLVVRGTLDASGDYLKNGASYTCLIDQAERISGTVEVIKVSTSDTDTQVMDSDEREYRIYYSSDCSALKGLNGQDAYIRKYGDGINIGDEIFVPGNDGTCALRNVQLISYDRPEKTEINADIKLPTVPTNVRALSTRNAVYVYWNPARDNEGISHYIVNASLYHTEDSSVRNADGPIILNDEIITADDTPHFRFTDFELDEQYFFRITAVDTSGNRSSYWSEEATTTTKSSIHDMTDTLENLRIFEQENDNSFLFRWNKNPGTGAYTVILEADGEHIYTNTSYAHSYIHILKKLERKGKKLKLIVRVTTGDDRVRLEDSVLFKF